MTENMIEVRELTKLFSRSGRANDRRDAFAAVNNVSFDVYKGEILGLLGESGCGKSTLARMLLHLILPDGGTIRWKGMEYQAMKESLFRPLRKNIQIVFQNPFGSLDPQLTIRSQLLEPLKIWMPGLQRDEMLDRIHAMLRDCGLDENTLQKRPGEFSGGQLQRISIARALLTEPEFLVADEIISALDVPIQNQILDLLVKMKEKMGLTVLFITHDLSVVRKISDRVMVMQQGQLLQIGSPEDVLEQSEIPYIRELASSVFTFT